MSARPHTKFLRFLFIALAGILPLPAWSDTTLVESVSSGSFGYVVLDTDIARPIAYWEYKKKGMSGRLKKTNRFEDFELGHNVRIVAMPPGKYQWMNILVPHYDLPSRMYIGKSDVWSFEVKRDAINYFGSLIVDEKRGTRSINTRLVNRSVMLYEKLSNDMPELLEKYEFVYTGYLQDDIVEQLGKGAAQ